jgi:hypothetical protein
MRDELPAFERRARARGRRAARPGLIHNTLTLVGALSTVAILISVIAAALPEGPTWTPPPMPRSSRF